MFMNGFEIIAQAAGDASGAFGGGLVFASDILWGGENIHKRFGKAGVR